MCDSHRPLNGADSEPRIEEARRDLWARIGGAATEALPFDEPPAIDDTDDPDVRSRWDADESAVWERE